MSTLSPQVAELKGLRDRRDAKLAPVVRDFKPAWILDVSVSAQREELVFDLVYRPYAGRGWIKRRYRYDGEVDVLHYTGELEFAENELAKLPETALIK
ncbi:MAG: hypothetical protein HGB05_08920 [Chloroflexi bacterium]|jgi:hypothetical protein|nr:hypothetical protein [Chloroflexota bacterium]